MNAWMHRTRWGEWVGNEGVEHLSFTTKKDWCCAGEIAFLFILHTSPSHLSDPYPIFPPLLARRRRILLSILVQQLLLVDRGGRGGVGEHDGANRYTHGYVGHLSAVWPVECFPRYLTEDQTHLTRHDFTLQLEQVLRTNMCFA